MENKGGEALNAFEKGPVDEKVIDASKKVKIGIIGTGWIAGSHVDAYKQMPDVEIVAAADLIDGKAAAFCERNGLKNVRLYKSHKELIDNEKELDGVSVCTYNREHAECAIYALEHGLNVMLEKPMCVTIEEAADIIRAEKRSGKILTIGFQPRYDPNAKILKRVIDSGVLGEIYYIQTGGGRRTGIPFPFGTTFIEDKTAGIGAMADIGCYSLDLVLNAIGYPKPLTASGYTSNRFGKNPDYIGYLRSNKSEYAKLFSVEDFAAAFVRLEGDIVLDFRISWAMNMDTMGDTIILGSKAGLRIPINQCDIGGDMTLFSTMGTETIKAKIDSSTERVNTFYCKLRAYVDAIKEGGAAPISSAQIFYNQAIIHSIVKSAKLHREVEVELPEI